MKERVDGEDLRVTHCGYLTLKQGGETLGEEVLKQEEDHQCKKERGRRDGRSV